MRGTGIIACAGAASVLTGIAVCLASAGNHMGQPPDWPAEWLGAGLIALPLLAAIMAVIAAVVVDASREHRRWLAAHTPEQQARIRKAEKAALLIGGLAAADLGLRELNKHQEEHTARLREIMHGPGSYAQRMTDQARAQQAAKEEPPQPGGSQVRRWVPPGW
jgi:hypothetical protein